MEGKKKGKKNSPISFVTTARSSARHWVGCPFQARPEWTVTDAVGQAELQPGVPILCTTIERRKKERAQRQKERKKKKKRGKEQGTVINTQLHIRCSKDSPALLLSDGFPFLKTTMRVHFCSPHMPHGRHTSRPSIWTRVDCQVQFGEECERRQNLS